MDSKHEQAEKDYLLGMKYKDIAAKYGVSIDTVKTWKKRYWQDTVRDKKTGPKKPNTKKDPIKKSVRKNNLPMITNDDPGLNERQRLFCLYFVNNRNATQAYLKAYGCSWATANTEGAQHLANPRIKAEINRLREIKAQSIMLGPDDIVERMMRIAFADMGDFVEWGTVEEPVLINGYRTIDADGNYLTRTRNFMNFKNSEQIDGGLVCQVSLGKTGMKIKLEDRQKAIEWLARWFDMNPMDRHKKAYDNAMLEIRKRELDLKDW